MLSNHFYYPIRNDIVKEINSEIVGEGGQITNKNQIEKLDALYKIASKGHGEKLRANIMNDMLSALVLDPDLVYFDEGTTKPLDIETHRATVREWMCDAISRNIENAGMGLQHKRAYQAVHIRARAKTLMHEKPIMLSVLEELIALNVYTEMLLELQLNPDSYFTKDKHHLGGEN